MTEPPPDLSNELQGLLNRHSAENGSNTPDYLLAEYLMACLTAYDEVVRKRDRWHGIQLWSDPVT